MSQVSTTTAITTTPQVTVVSSSMSSLSFMTMAPSLMGLPTMLSQHDVAVATPDTMMLWQCSWPCLCATASTSILDASSGLCQLCHGFSPGRFLFQSWASHHFVYYRFGVCSTFRCQTGCHIHPWGLNCWGLQHCIPLEFTHGRHMCNLVMVISLHQVCTEWLLPPLHCRGSLLVLSLQFPSHSIYMVGI